MTLFHTSHPYYFVKFMALLIGRRTVGRENFSIEFSDRKRETIPIAFTFSTLPSIYIENNNSLNSYIMTQPTKRQYRNDMTPEQREKISQKLKGRTLSNDTKRKISQSMEKYWASLPTKPITNTTSPYKDE